ncbi:MAG: RHS repeat domain-containing protein, partial [Gammaproteobacteria bacterium]
LPNGVDLNYVYDNASQLTSITYKKGAVTLGDLTYVYDTAGRRSRIGGSFARTDVPTAIATSSHNANNQLTNWAGPTLTYDFNGNLTGDGTYLDTWNARNQLVQVRQGGTTIASYEYDAFGRRKQKVVNGVTTRFVYDGQNFVQERDAGNAVTANVLTGLGLDEVYARTKGAVTSSYLIDHLGTIIAEADAAGTVQTSYSYEPYGKTTQSGAASDNSQRYTGREQDLAHLYYYRARYYSATFGRFASEDPIDLLGGSNLYGYVGSAPIHFIDPLGLAAQVTAGIGGSIGGLIFPAGFFGFSVGVGVTSGGQFVVQVQGTGSMGIGVFAGFGAQFGVTQMDCPLPVGWSDETTVQGDFNFGAGPSVGGSAQFGLTGGGGFSTGGGPRVRGGVGYGVQASVGVTRTFTYATPSVFGRNNSSCGCP